MAPGDYSGVSIRNVNPSVSITITSQNADDQAHFTTLRIADSSSITIKGVDIGRGLLPGESDDATMMTKVTGSSKIVFDSVHVHGSLDGDPSNDGVGIHVSGSTGVKVLNSEFEQLFRAVVLSGIEGAEVAGNKFHDIRSDGLDLISVRGAKIDSNSFTDFFKTGGDHADAIQVWTTGTTKASTDIVISNNQIMQGKGKGLQGIFMRDELETLPFERVTIENNLIAVRDMANGIAVLGGKDITVRGNSVVSPGNDNTDVWIRLEKVKGGVVENNLADSLSNSSDGVTFRNNVFLAESPKVRAQLRDLNLGGAAKAGGLTIAGIGYQLKGTGSALDLTLAKSGVSPSLNSSASTVLLDIKFSNAGASDSSQFGSRVGGNFSAANVSQNAYHVYNGSNAQVVRKTASQIYGLDAFTLSFSLKRDSATKGDGSVMRLQNAWELSLTKTGELAFTFSNEAGQKFAITTSGAKINDINTHAVSVTFDDSKAVAKIFVDGNEVGKVAATGKIGTDGTRDLFIGNPYGSSFSGFVGNIKLTDKASYPGGDLSQSVTKKAAAIEIVPVAEPAVFTTAALPTSELPAAFSTPILATTSRFGGAATTFAGEPKTSAAASVVTSTALLSTRYSLFHS